MQDFKSDLYSYFTFIFVIQKILPLLRAVMLVKLLNIWHHIFQSFEKKALAIKYSKVIERSRSILFYYL